MQKEMNIAFITPSLKFGGRERVLSKLINFFSQQEDTNVHVILYAKKREINFEIDPKTIIHTPEFSANCNEKFYALKSLRYIRKTVKCNKIDTIVSFEEKWNRFALLAVAGLKLRRIISNRNNPYRDYGFIDRKLAQWLYPKVDVLIAQTNIAKEVYEKKYKLKRCVVIGNPIDKLNVDFSKIVRENIIVCVSRLMKSKNHDRLINNFSETQNENWKLVLVGGDHGNDNISQKLKEQIKSLNLEDKVVLVGASKEVNEYLLKSKIFAFTSEREGFPNVVGEAMAAQLPVVSYDCVAGPRDMIDDGINGYLVPVYDDKLFVEKLNHLMTNEEERKIMGEKASEKIGLFDSEKICNKFYNIIVK